jgi:dihydrodipicolinate synthase/N-acetylneuraminate lyase
VAEQPYPEREDASSLASILDPHVLPTANSHTPSPISGILPIVYTPFDQDGAIDEDDLGRLVEYLIAAGVHGLAAVGGASECHKMSLEERKRLAEVTVILADGRVPVIVGTSATCIADSVTLSRHAESIGAVAIFATPPIYGGASRESNRATFQALSKVTTITIMVQDAGIPLSAMEMASLVNELDRVEYVKEESLEPGHKTTELLALTGGRVKVLSNATSFLDDLARGVVGAIPGSIGCGDLSRCYDRWVQGNRVTARAAFNHFLPLSSWRRQFPILAAKEVLRRLGVFKVAVCREPAGPTMDHMDHEELTRIMEGMGPPY